MKKTCRRLAILVPLLIAVVQGPALADGGTATRVVALKEENAEERINYSGKLRMLSQRIPSAACHLSRGIDVEGARAAAGGTGGV